MREGAGLCVRDRHSHGDAEVGGTETRDVFVPVREVKRDERQSSPRGAPKCFLLLVAFSFFFSHYV